MSAIIYDSNWLIAQSCGDRVFSAPIPGVNTEYVFEQPFTIKRSSFVRMDLNTPDTEFSEFVLVEETTPQDMGARCCKWNRVYAKKPAQHSEYENYNYTFIGLHGQWGPGVTSATGRDGFTKTVASRIAHDYFLVGAGGDYASASLIPIIEGQAYYFDVETQLTGYLGDSPPFSVASTPSRTDYETMVTNGTEIAAEDSRLTRWIGNYWLRQTRYLKAL